MEKKTSWRIGIIALLCCALVLCAVWAVVRPGEPADQPAEAADAPAEQDNNESAAADASSEFLTKRDQGWISDIRFLQQTFTDEHPAPFWLLPQEDFDRQIDELIDQVPKLSDLEIGMELQRIVAQIGDQHSQVYFYEGLSAYPVDFYMNDDGTVYLYQARFGDSDAQTYIMDYYQVVRINNVDIQYIVNQLKELSSSAANAYNYVSNVRHLLPYRDILKGVGIPCEGDTDTFTLIDEQGRTFDIEVAAGGDSSGGSIQLAESIPSEYLRTTEPVTLPLCLINEQSDYWHSYLESENAMYFAVHHFRRQENEKNEEIFSAFLQEMFASFDTNNAEKLIIDLRGNPGGNDMVRGALTAAIEARPELKGKLYALIDARTFSAGVICAQELSEKCDAILVGTPTGGTPWGFGYDGDKSNHVLPYSGIAFSCGSVYYVGEKYYYGQKFNSPQFAMANFFPPLSNNTVMPDVYISTDIQDLAEGRDPALEWVLAQ